MPHRTKMGFARTQPILRRKIQALQGSKMQITTLTKLILSAACLLVVTPPASADKLDDVKARGRLLVGTSDTSPPFSARENGKVVGYDVDLAARVAKRLALPM